MQRKLFLCACLAFSSFAASAEPAADTAPTSESIYKCYRVGYDPPVCEKVSSSPNSNFAELLAATRAARTGKSIRVTKLVLGGTQTSVSTPVLECGNGHGQSACCRIVADINDILYIECG